MYSLIILSNSVTSHIHLNILVSATLISISFFLINGQPLINMYMHKNSFLLENTLHNIFFGTLSYVFSKTYILLLTHDSLILHISHTALLL